jgi:hypothetical protein
MAHYQIYCMDRPGHISLAQAIDAESDEQAIEKAKAAKANAIKCEVWQGKRMVATLDAQDLAD